MNRLPADAIARALERFAGDPGEATLRDLSLLVNAAAKVGLDVLRWQTWRLQRYVDLQNPRLGFDVVADLFAGDPGFPALRLLAAKIVAAAAGDPSRAALHFRNEIVARACNHARRQLREANPGGYSIRRNILLQIDPERRRGNRILFGAARPAERQPIASRQHTEELWDRLGGRAARIPRLLAATEAILAAHPEHAEWIELSQLESDYLEVMTFRSIWPQSGEPDEDPGQSIDYAAVLSFWDERGAALTLERFRSRTEAREDEVDRLFAGYCKYFQVWVKSSARVEQSSILAEFIPGLTRERFRKEYRRIFAGLHDLAIGVLRERFAPRPSALPGGETACPSL